MMRAHLVALLSGLVSIPLLWPSLAQACGGTFCDRGPTAMPVDQSGENVLFVLDGKFVEAHIQIQYDPDTEAEQFAWVIPVPTLPEFSVGSDPFFDAVLGGSQPVYARNDTLECSPPNGPNGGSGGSFISTPDGGAGGGPSVLAEEVVGAFDVVVLQGGTSEELMAWLDDNGYQQDPTAEPILDQYVSEGMLFAAFKLRHSAGVDEIHPIVMRYEGNEPCVPLRLTRIAALDDMDIRVFFLSENRVAPTNYKHTLVNPLRIDWVNLGANYKGVISLAVDAPEADGRAFVTEYAGASDVVTGSLHGDDWDPSQFLDLEPVEVTVMLEDQRLAFCYQDVGCEFASPLLLPILREYLPPPADVDEQLFYGCVKCYDELIDLSAWDAAAFAADLAERIVEPALRADELLETWPYLTRMYTTISPHEMIADPMFAEQPSLPDVEALRMAEVYTFCSGDQLWTLPDGREVFLPNGQPWPNFQAEMPYEEDIDEFPFADMPAIGLVDNTALIDRLLSEWNAMNGWPPGSSNTGGPDGEGTGSTSGGAGGSGGVETGSSCACRSDGGSIPAPGALLLCAGLVGLRRRRG